MRINISNITGLQKTYDNIGRAKAVIGRGEYIKEIERKIKVRYMYPMMRKLKKYPEKRRYPQDYPIEFTSDKQRKYVMWLLEGKPYRRTGDLRKSWKFNVEYVGSKLRIKVYNELDHYIYIVGYLGLGLSSRSVSRYIKPMQRFHTLTGWNPAYKYTRHYGLRIRSEANDMIRDHYLQIMKMVG
jgi:hypothetical protein